MTRASILVLLALAAPALAEDPPAPPSAAAPAAAPAAEAPERQWIATPPIRRSPRRVHDERELRYVRPGERLDLQDVLDEILDEVAADVARNAALKLSPMLIERIAVSPNLTPEVAFVLEARLAAALARAADVVVVRCVECDTTHAQVTDAAWVVSRGLVRREQLLEVAKRYGGRTFLTATLTAGESPVSVSLDVEIVRAEDAAILYAETYRFRGDTAMLYRGVDRAVSRDRKLKELEDRIDGKPSFGYAAMLGGILIPSTGGNDPDEPKQITAPFGGLRLHERFGSDLQHRMTLFAGGITAARAGFAGGMLLLGPQFRVSPPNLFNPTVYVGGVVGWFIGGSVGDAPMAGATFEILFGARLGMHAQLLYLKRFRYLNEPDEPMIGGLSPQMGVTLSW